MAKIVHKTNKKKQTLRHNKQEVASAFLDLIAICEHYIHKLCGRIFVVIKRSLTFKIMLASGNARLNACDEKIFDCYMYLMRQYQDAIELYEQNQAFITNVKLKNIVHGVYSVLLSRVRMMRENSQNTRENPIKAEKSEIIGKSVHLFMKNIDVVQKQFVAEKGDGLLKELRMLCLEKFDIDTGVLMTDAIVSAVFDDCERDFYIIAMNSVKDCLTNLNDSHKRYATMYYYDLLGIELEILTSIIKIQIQAIENELNISNSQTREKTVVDDFLSKLSGAYQVFSKDVEEITACFQEAESKNTPPSMDDYQIFSSDLRAQTEVRHIFPTQLFQENRKEYEKRFSVFEKQAIQAVSDKIERKTGKYVPQKNVYNLQKSVAENKIMANEMIEAFEEICRWKCENDELLSQCDQADIISGICETIDIKKENLADGTQLFVDECQALIEQAKNEKTSMTDEEKQALTQACFDKIYSEFIKIFNESLDAEHKEVEGLSLKSQFILESCLDNEKARTMLGLQERTIENQRNAVAKKTLNFKRDTLLYEMSTFEEILNYSVSRLRETQDPYVAGFVSVIDRTTKSLVNILNKNNVFMIAPKPHELFNGKEQEVLMAEKNEGFQKGEIIKVMNSGYKQDDVVIMRANVIAAK